MSELLAELVRSYTECSQPDVSTCGTLEDLKNGITESLEMTIARKKIVA